MKADKNPEAITIRTPKDSAVVSDLMLLAEADGGRSLNNYINLVLAAHVKSKKRVLSKLKPATS